MLGKKSHGQRNENGERDKWIFVGGGIIAVLEMIKEEIDGEKIISK